MNFTNLSILVSSFDQYSVCWYPFRHGLEKYWPDHPPVYFITNHLNAPIGTSIKIGDDRGWAGNLSWGLTQIDTEFILYCQEDYWITTPVDSSQINDYLDVLQSDRADYIRLYPAPPPDLPFPGDHRLGILKRTSQYRTSLQMALWRTSTVKDLLDIHETPWQFEMKASIRSSGWGDRFLCVTNIGYGIDYVFTAVKNGYWSPQAYTYAYTEQLDIAFETLPKKPLGRRLADLLKSSAYRIKKKGLKQFRIGATKKV